MNTDKKQFIIESLCYSIIAFISLYVITYFNFFFGIAIFVFLIVLIFLFSVLKSKNKWYKSINKQKTTKEKVIQTIIFILVFLISNTQPLMKLLALYAYIIFIVILEYRRNFKSE